MVRIYVATGDAVAILRPTEGDWQAELQMRGLPIQCLAVDPLIPERVYCGTFGRGLWQSDDGAHSWRPVEQGVPYQEVMSVSVSRLERFGDNGVLWVGTEPSALFRSEDGGTTWVERPALRHLPSAPTWSFPPRPWTSHVRCIAPDSTVRDRLFVGIELGGVMRSLDGGLTWEDRKPDAQPDSHALATHRLAPGRVYETAGGGYAESLDGGTTWRRYDDGLPWHYLWGLAVDPADPDTVVVSVSPGPGPAHDPHAGESVICRRRAGGSWEVVSDGLPEPKGTRAYVLATNDAEPGVFYAATREADLYRSPDSGGTWERLSVDWPAGYRPRDVNAMSVVETE